MAKIITTKVVRMSEQDVKNDVGFFVEAGRSFDAVTFSEWSGHDCSYKMRNRIDAKARALKPGQWLKVDVK